MKAGLDDYVVKSREHPGRLRGSVRSALERAQLRRAQKTSELRYRGVFDNVPIGLFVVSPDGTIIDANEALLNILGFDREGPLPVQNVRDFQINTDDAARWFAKLMRDGIIRDIEVELVRPDGRTVWLETSARVERDEKNSVLFYQGVVEDTTGHRQLQEQFLHSQKMEAVGRLAGGIAHDFNNLLTAILGYNALLLKEIAPGHPLRAHAEEVRHAAERAASLTRQLLAFSRKQTLSMGVLDLNLIVGEIEKLLRRLIGEEIDMQTHLAGALHNVRADRGQIEQVIINLVVNARDAMADGGQLTIRTANVTLGESKPPALAQMRAGDYAMLSPMKIVVAYSGGLDTDEDVRRRLLRRVRAAHLAEGNLSAEIIAFCADVGQEEELDGLEAKALRTGASKCFIDDLREEFARDFIFPMIQAGAIYEGQYYLGTSIARPLIAKRMVEIARAEKADAVAHGATGKGNDQVRFELTAAALAPELRSSRRGGRSVSASNSPGARR
jgi:PAS domain S-box-containing protein